MTKSLTTSYPGSGSIFSTSPHNLTRSNNLVRSALTTAPLTITPDNGPLRRNESVGSISDFIDSKASNIEKY